MATSTPGTSKPEKTAPAVEAEGAPEEKEPTKFTPEEEAVRDPSRAFSARRNYG